MGFHVIAMVCLRWEEKGETSISGSVTLKEQLKQVRLVLPQLVVISFTAIICVIFIWTPPSGIISFLLLPSYTYSWRTACSLFSLATFNLAGVSFFSLDFPALTLAAPVLFFLGGGYNCVNYSILRPEYTRGNQEYQLFHCVFTTELW